MAHYCDTKVLEQNWFNWLIAQATPCLDQYRNRGLLASKVIPIAAEQAEGEKVHPFWGCHARPRRSHCFMVGQPIYCNSYSGQLSKPTFFSGSRPIVCDLPPINSIPDQSVLNKVVSAGYVVERPIKTAWDAILMDVNMICKGISLKFNLPSEEAHEELASDALLQVTNKIKNLTLVFTPGVAPVFNLLTTTIYRVMYSLLNKITKDQKNRTEHAQLIAPLALRGQNRLRGRIVTKRVCGSLISCSNR